MDRARRAAGVFESCRMPLLSRAWWIESTWAVFDGGLVRLVAVLATV